MIPILVVLLGVCLAAYFGLDVYADAVGASDLRLRYLDVSLLNENFFAFLGACILFLQFAIILFSMLDRIADTLRVIIRPLALLIPLVAFLVAIWRTFYPIIMNLMPQEMVGAAGSNPEYLAAIYESGELTERILFTLLTMILFLMASRALSTESAKVRDLEAKLDKYRRAFK